MLLKRLKLPPEEVGAYHTLGGFVMARLGRVPKTADRFDWGQMQFEVVDMDGRRTDKVLVSRIEAEETGSEAAANQDSGREGP